MSLKQRESLVEIERWVRWWQMESRIRVFFQRRKTSASVINTDWHDIRADFILRAVGLYVPPS
jgi:hypothetical protein